jgi:hypothetical protein
MLLYDRAKRPSRCDKLDDKLTDRLDDDGLDNDCVFIVRAGRKRPTKEDRSPSQDAKATLNDY